MSRAELACVVVVWVEQAFLAGAPAHLLGLPSLDSPTARSQTDPREPGSQRCPGYVLPEAKGAMRRSSTLLHMLLILTASVLLPGAQDPRSLVSAGSLTFLLCAMLGPVCLFF